MSIIAWDGKSLAADRRSVDCDMATMSNKIREINSGPHEGHIIAWCGCAASGTYLANWYESGAIPEMWPTQAQMDKETVSTLIVVTPEGCKHYHGTTHPIALPVNEPFRAWGSGRDYAMGAMAMGATAKEAVEIAAKFCITCGGGVDVYELLP